jgi:hypothetical protein
MLPVSADDTTGGRGKETTSSANGVYSAPYLSYAITLAIHARNSISCPYDMHEG